MLPAGFFLGNATTLLLWLFQMVPHEVLLVMLGVMSMWCLWVISAVAMIVLYLGLVSLCRLVRLVSTFVMRVFSRLRTLWAPRANVPVSSSGARAQTRLVPLDPYVLRAARIGEPPTTPLGLNSVEPVDALPPSDATPQLGPGPSIPALPAPPRRRTRRSSTPNKGRGNSCL